MSETDPSKRIVVTGMGMVSPLGLDVQSSWEALIRGEHGVQNIRDGVLEGYPITAIGASIGAPVKGFDLIGNNPAFDNTETKRKLKFWHRSAQFALEASHQAMEQANLLQGLQLDQSQIDPARFAVSIGTGIGGANALIEVNNKLDESRASGEASRVNSFAILHALPSRPSEVVSIVLGPGNETTPIYSAESVFAQCATGNANIISVAEKILMGHIDLGVAGGVEAAMAPAPIGGFVATRAVDTSADPNISPRPFDKNRNGLVFGEGAGVLVIEELEHARARGATVLAELTGYGTSADGYKDTDGSGYGAKLALKRTLGSVGLKLDRTTYINAHGTGTAGGDNTEMRIISEVFIPERSYVSSNKSSMGHTFGAAAAIEGIFSIWAVREGIMPPSRNLDEPIEEVTNWFGAGWREHMSPHEASEVPFDVAINTAFGFGGHNSITEFSRYSPDR